MNQPPPNPFVYAATAVCFLAILVLVVIILFKIGEWIWEL